MIPGWFTAISISMLILGGICTLIIADILFGHRQPIWIMNIVWPVTALFGSVISVWAYFKYGRLATAKTVQTALDQDDEMPNLKYTPFPAMVGKGTAHCGAGCTLGDICAEFLALGIPAVVVLAGWKGLFPANETGKILAVWIIDYIFAFGFGVAFQYFTIKPLRNLSTSQGLIQAGKADALLLTAWQVGMHGLMAISHFVLFKNVWDDPVNPSMPEFWFTMQLAMIAGFATSYPVNWWLIRQGIKEEM